MTCKTECTQFELAMELLIENGFDGILHAIPFKGATPLPLLWTLEYSRPGLQTTVKRAPIAWLGTSY